MSITLIIPALNEQAVIRNVAEQAIDCTRTHFADYEVILVDDGSTDSTGEIMETIARNQPNVRVLHNDGNRGLGTCYQRGVALASKNYIMLLCGDGGLPAASLPAIYACVGRADIVIPYMRNLRQIKTPFRYFLSRTYTRLLNILFGFHLNYYNGLPVHRADLLRKITITSKGFGFQGEVLIKLLKSGCTYVQVGVNGAEETRRSFALRPLNFVSVIRTLLHLIREVMWFQPVPREIIENGRVDVSSPAPSRARGSAG